MWKIVVQPDRTEIKVWRKRIACWVIKATHTHTHTHTLTYTLTLSHSHSHTISNSYYFSTAKMVTRTCLNFFLYTYNACLVYLNNSSKKAFSEMQMFFVLNLIIFQLF